MLILHDIIEIPIQYYTKHVCTAEGKRTWAKYEYYFYSSFLSGVLARAIYVILLFKVETVRCTKDRNETHQSRAIVLYSLSLRFSCANFRSGVPGIPVSVSRLNCSQCARDPAVCVCVRCIVLNDIIRIIRDTHARIVVPCV